MKLTNATATDLLIAAEAHAARGETDLVFRLIRAISDGCSWVWWRAATPRLLVIYPDATVKEGGA